MSNIYADDNIHDALEKVAGESAGTRVESPSGTKVKVKIPGGSITLPPSVSRSYINARGTGSFAMSDKSNLKAIKGTVQDINAAKSGKPHAFHHTDEKGKPIGKPSPYGQEGEARITDAIKSLEKSSSVASDDNIHTALEKVAISKRLGAAVGGGLMGAGLYGAYKALSGKRSKYHEPDPAKVRKTATNFDYLLDDPKTSEELAEVGDLSKAEMAAWSRLKKDPKHARRFQ